MKLRNKKTGETADYNEFEYDLLSTYNSLSELNEEWEDYKELKVAYFIDSQGDICVFSDTEVDDWTKEKQIGNYFKTKEEAEKTVEKLKAWKRLKDIGYSFDGWNVKTAGSEGDHLIINMHIKDCTGCEELLDLLFGGEEWPKS